MLADLADLVDKSARLAVSPALADLADLAEGSKVFLADLKLADSNV